MIKGNITKNLLINNFWLSLTIHEPQKRFTAKKCVQNVIRKKLSLNSISNLTFFEPDLNKFPGLKLGWEVLQNPNSSPVVLNASNEIAVDAFLKNKVKFTDIYNIVYETLNVCKPSIPKNIDDIIEIDNIARMNALNLIKRKFYKWLIVVFLHHWLVFLLF